MNQDTMRLYQERKFALLNEVLAKDDYLNVEEGRYDLSTILVSSDDYTKNFTNDAVKSYSEHLYGILNACCMDPISLCDLLKSTHPPTQFINDMKLAIRFIFNIEFQVFSLPVLQVRGKEPKGSESERMRNFKKCWPVLSEETLELFDPLVDCFRSIISNIKNFITEAATGPSDNLIRFFESFMDLIDDLRRVEQDIDNEGVIQSNIRRALKSFFDFVNEGTPHNISVNDSISPELRRSVLKNTLTHNIFYPNELKSILGSSNGITNNIISYYPNLHLLSKADIMINQESDHFTQHYTNTKKTPVTPLTEYLLRESFGKNLRIHDEDGHTKLIFTTTALIEVKFADLSIWIADDGKSFEFSTYEAFDSFCLVLRQILRYCVDSGTITEFFISNNDSVLFFTISSLQNLQLWNSTNETDLIALKDRFKETRDLSKKEFSLEYGIVPFNYLIFQNGFTNVDIGGTTRIMSFQMFLAARVHKLTLKQLKLRSYEAEILPVLAQYGIKKIDDFDENPDAFEKVSEKLLNIDTSYLRTLSELSATFLIHLRLSKLISDEIEKNEPEEGNIRSINQIVGNIRSINQIKADDFGILMQSNETNIHIENKNTDFVGHGSSSKSFYNEDNASDVGSIFDNNGIESSDQNTPIFKHLPPVRSENIETFYIPSEPDYTPYKFECYQNMGETADIPYLFDEFSAYTYSHVLLYDTQEFQNYFPTLIQSAPTILNYKSLILKIYDKSGIVRQLIQEKDTAEYEPFHTDKLVARIEKDHYQREVDTYSKIQNYNLDAEIHNQNHLENTPDFKTKVHVPDLLCYGSMDFDTLSINPADMNGKFEVLEYIDGLRMFDQEREEALKNDDFKILFQNCELQKKLYEEGLEQLRLLHSLGIFHNDLEDGRNIIIQKMEETKFKLYFVDFDKAYQRNTNTSYFTDEMSFKRSFDRFFNINATE